MASLSSIQVGMPRDRGDPTEVGIGGRQWTTSFWKSPVAGPVEVGRDNLAGDAQADRVNHGGPDKAVCVYSLDHYPYWREVFAVAGALDSLSTGDIPNGGFGENFSIARLTESDVCIGDLWRIGDAVFQISQPRQPCWKLARRWGIKTLAAQVIETGKTGWYFRVVEEGTVAAGMEMTLVERPSPEWTIERANHVMHHDKHNREVAVKLAELAELSRSWRDELRRRYPF